MKRFSRMVLCILLLSVAAGIQSGYAQDNSVIIPNVEGIAQDVAAQILRTVGLQPRFRSSSDLSALVTAQEPRPGFSVTQGSEVLLMTGAVDMESLRTISVLQTPEKTGTVSVKIAGEASVSPLANTPRQAVTVAESTPFATSRFRVYAQPQQTPVNPNVMADTTAKRYPPWYPKAFLNPGAVTQKSAVQVSGTSNQSKILYEGWYYPQKWSKQKKEASSEASPTVQSDEPSSIQDIQPLRIQVAQESGSGYIPPVPTQSTQVVLKQEVTGYIQTPLVIRLNQDDAIYAIKKAGLKVGTMTRVQHEQLKSGVVVEQSPRGKALVEIGTTVNLWVTE